MADGTQNDSTVPDWAKGATVGAPVTKVVSATDTNAPDWAKGARVGAPVTQSVSQQSTFPEPVENSLIAANNIAQSAVAIPGELLKAVTAPPTSPTEQLLHAVSPGGLPIYRLARNIISAAERAKLAGPGEYAQAVQDYQNAVSQFKDHDWRNAIPSAVNVATDVSRAANPVLEMADPDNLSRQISEGTRPGHNLAGPLTTAGITAILAAAPEFAEGGALAPAASTATASPAASAAARVRVNPFRAAVQGEKAVQPAASRIMTEGAQAAAADSAVPAANITGGIRTYLDEPIANVASRERATYDALNKASGTDLKNLYDTRSSVLDALDDPTNIAQEHALRARLADTEAQIRTGEAQATQSGVSPKSLQAAKADTQQRYALQDMKSKLFNNESVVKGNIANGSPESIDIGSAIKQVEKLDKPSKFAPEGSPTRLEQALGTKGAKQFKDDLYAAQKAGQKAAKIQKVSLWLSGIIGAGAVGHAVTGF